MSVVCPIAQGSPKLLASALRIGAKGLLSPVIDCAEGNLESKEFLASCERLAKELKLNDGQWREAWRAGVEAQKQFDAGCREIGRRALEFCRAQNIVPVVVLGRAYTIYNKVLNSNVPAILREQGAIGIPLDCYPLDADNAGVRGHVLGLWPGHSARGPSSAARGGSLCACIAAIIPAGRTVSICISRLT